MLKSSNNFKDTSPNRILRTIVEGPEWLKDFTFIIFGRSGPTGKTWLYKGLKQYGFRAIEITSAVNAYAQYTDNDNYVIEDHFDKTITIILNKYL